MIQIYLIAPVAEMLESGYSYRDITTRHNVSNGTVTKIKRFCETLNLTSKEIGEMDCDALQDLFNPPGKRQTSHRHLPDFKGIYERTTASQARSNLTVEWENYIREHPEGYQYTQFCHHFNKWLEKNTGNKNVTMALNRVPAEFVYIDWVGDRISVVKDPETGEMREAHFLVTTIGVSSLIYIKAFPNEKEDCVIDGINSALRYYGGLPRYLRPDNMKTAVTSNNKNGVKLNAVMEDLQDFYKVPVRPARPLRPRDKGSVEAACKYVEERVMSQLKSRTFYSFPELNSEIAACTEKLNDRISRRTGKSRRQLFTEVDQPALAPLPEGYFRPCEYLMRTVQKNDHIEIDKEYYSVPYELYTKEGRKVVAKVGWDQITICDENNRFICSHERSPGGRKHTYHTADAHRPPNHSAAARQMEANSQWYKNWAADIGPCTGKLIALILDEAKWPEQKYKSCDAILHKAKTDRKIAENASKSTLDTGTTSVRYFTKIFNELKKAGTPVKHSNIRGGENYR